MITSHVVLETPDRKLSVSVVNHNDIVEVHLQQANHPYECVMMSITRNELLTFIAKIREAL